jgi:hypothetical protein
MACSKTGEEQSQGHALIFFDIKGSFRREIIMAGQTVNSAYYCDVLWCFPENLLTLHPEL